MMQNWGFYVAKYSIPMTDPYVNGRLMLTKLRVFVDGQCGSTKIAYIHTDPMGLISEGIVDSS